LQWGDEAKGKLVDLLSETADIVVRYQGGANAGHTVVFNGKTFKLHQLPTGVLTPSAMNVVAAGVVVHPATLIEEIERLTSQGFSVDGRLLLSDRAHVVFPWHVAEDRWREQASAAAIGTTQRGIGPCYGDKYRRTDAIRLGELTRPGFAERVRSVASIKERWLPALGCDDPSAWDAAAIAAEYAVYGQRLKPYIADSTTYLLDAVEQDRDILFEGAQGSLLDIDHGTYPFVTSSNSSGVGITAGAGVPPSAIDRVVGVAKCYATRVGGGPFPTELTDELGEHIRRRGKEYGTTTGRPRRCGWFDAVAVRYTARLSGVTSLALMMLDVLSELDEIQVCVAYELDGQTLDRFPSQAEDLARVQPQWETLPGWGSEISDARTWSDLPHRARQYVERLAELVDRPIGFISVGPDREQTIRCDRTLYQVNG